MEKMQKFLIFLQFLKLRNLLERVCNHIQLYKFWKYTGDLSRNNICGQCKLPQKFL